MLIYGVSQKDLHIGFGLGWLALGSGRYKENLWMDKRRLLQRETMDNAFA